MRLRQRDPPRAAAPFDVAAAGPLAGFAALLPVLCIGVALSAPAPLEAMETARAVGHPALLQTAVALIHGPVGDGYAIALHPLATAAWIGMLLTALNLFPAGQLDGGHVAHALLPRPWARAAGLAAASAAALLSTESAAWIVWTLVTSTMTFTNWNTAPWIEPPAAVGTGRRIVAAVLAMTLALCFTPVPLGPLRLTRPRRQTPADSRTRDTPRTRPPTPFTRKEHMTSTDATPADGGVAHAARSEDDNPTWLAAAWVDLKQLEDAHPHVCTDGWPTRARVEHGGRLVVEIYCVETWHKGDEYALYCDDFKTDDPPLRWLGSVEKTLAKLDKKTQNGRRDIRHDPADTPNPKPSLRWNSRMRDEEEYVHKDIETGEPIVDDNDETTFDERDGSIWTRTTRRPTPARRSPTGPTWTPSSKPATTRSPSGPGADSSGNCARSAAQSSGTTTAQADPARRDRPVEYANSHDEAWKVILEVCRRQTTA